MFPICLMYSIDLDDRDDNGRPSVPFECFLNSCVDILISDAFGPAQDMDSERIIAYLRRKDI